MPRRRRLASQPWTMCLRDRPPMFGPSDIGLKTLVATTHSSRLANSRRAPSGNFLADAQRVHVGGVEEVDAGLDRPAEEGTRGGLVEHPRAPVRVAVAHAAQAQPRYGYAGAAQKGVFHVSVQCSVFSVQECQAWVWCSECRTARGGQSTGDRSGGSSSQLVSVWPRWFACQYCPVRTSRHVSQPLAS